LLLIELTDIPGIFKGILRIARL